MHTSLVRRRFWISMRRRTNYTTILGCNAVCVVVWEPYSSGRCSVLALTGVFRFLLVSLYPADLRHFIFGRAGAVCGPTALYFGYYITPRAEFVSVHGRCPCYLDTGPGATEACQGPSSTSFTVYDFMLSICATGTFGSRESGLAVSKITRHFANVEYGIQG